MKEEFEDTEGVIRIRKSKDRQYNVQKKKNKRLIRVITKLPNSEQSYKGKVKTHNYTDKISHIYKTLHKKLKIE